MKKPNMKNQYASTFHRNGTVSFWDVYAQQWAQMSARDLFACSEIMASMSKRDWARVERMARK